MKLIDKDALVAEIERRIDELCNYPATEPEQILSKSASLKPLMELRLFLNTLEVKEGDIITKEEKHKLMRKCVHNAYQRGYKTGVTMATNEIIHKQEVDLEKEIDKWYNNEASKEFENVLYEDIEKCAKHFFELGLKTQKGE